MMSNAEKHRLMMRGNFIYGMIGSKISMKEVFLMIRKPEEFTIDYKEHMRDGDGTVQLTHFIKGPEELNGKGRLFSKITLIASF